MRKKEISYSSILFNFIVGVILGYAFKITSGTDFNPLLGGVCWEALAIVISLISRVTGKQAIAGNVLAAGLLKEIWISRLLEKYYPIAPWLTRGQDFTGLVENNTIHLGEIGVDPTVLINNTTYPVPFAERADVPLALSLDYYDTQGVVVRNAEQMQLAYNKLDTVIRQHGHALAKAQSSKAAWNFAPAANSTFTPVFTTKGYPKTSYAAGARLPFSLDRIIAAEQAFDALDIPAGNRVLVLCTQHKQDLLAQDVNLFKGFTDYKNGMVGQLYGFDIYTTSQCPTYNNTTLAKNAYGATPASTDAICSFFFVADEVMYARGTMDMFSRLRDPEAKGDIVNFQQRFVALSIRNKYQGAIVDAITAAAITNP
jgi:hypothetical protein